MGGGGPTAWRNWAVGVLAGISAPITPVNVTSLWNWSVKESGFDVMRWNNPLNTTRELRAGIDVDPDMNAVGVESYPSVSDGIQATLATLLNGLYPTLVANLRGQVSYRAWQNAAHELDTWGSGTDWLSWTLMPPLLPQEALMLPTNRNFLFGFVHWLMFTIYHRDVSAPEVEAVLALFPGDGSGSNLDAIVQNLINGVANPAAAEHALLATSLATAIKDQKNQPLPVHSHAVTGTAK